MIQTSISTALSNGVAAATGLPVSLRPTLAGPSVPLQSTTAQATAVATQLLGLAVFAGLLAAVVALVYRWASREQVPVALALLVGLSGVALYLNTTSVLGQVIAGETGLTTDVSRALFNIGAFLAGGVGSVVGQRAGDRFSTDVILDTETSDVDAEVNRLVRTVGRVIVVTLPDDIDDVVGYDPVAEETKEKLAGKRFLFPRTLTVGQLRDRLVARLKTDYGVGTVDLELADDGTVEYLALGSRAAGIGPTLPPATNAVAIRADPAFAASAGDLVQVWETEPMRRVLTAELRGVADDVVTIAIDAADTPKIDPRQQYRLVTLPVEDRPEREFASLLRAADETFSTITVEAGSPLHGLPVGALDLLVVAVKSDDDGSTPIPLPADEQLLAPGDTVFVIGRPERLRRLEIAATPLDPSLVEDVGSPSIGASTPETEPAQEPGPATGSPADGSAGADEPAAVGEPLLDEGTPADGPTADSGVAPGPDTDSDTSTEATAGAGADTTGDDAGGSTFDELKDEFESGDADWEAEDEDDDEPIESIAGGSGGGTEPDEAEKTDDSSFDELKAEFESGDADWDEGDSGSDDVSAEPESTDDGGDDLVGLEDADISFDEGGAEDGGSDDEDDDLETFDLDDESDGAFDLGESDEEFDLGESDDEFELDDGGDGAFDLDDGDGEDVLDLGLDEDDDKEGLSLDDDDDDSAEEDADDEDDEDDDDDDGGGSTFAQLKEEFESGDADWEDDISDSPGGDMRLDE
jgi:hypothetical protein